MNRIVVGVLLGTLALQAQQVESFDAVWKTVADKHWNPQQLEALPGGGSWSGLRDSYRKRVEAASGQAEVRTILREMLSKIGKSHYAIAGMEMKGPRSMRQGGGTSPGFKVGLVEGKVVVTGLSAKMTSVALGWELVAVGGQPLHKTTEAAGTLQAGLRIHQMLQNQISGFAGQELTYEFVLPTGLKKSVSLTMPQGDGSAGFGFVQGMNVQREFKLLGKAKDIGYFRLDMFLDVVRVLPQFEQAIRACERCKGFVIDLRGNPGGVAVMANAMSGWFVKESDVKLGTMYQRGVDLKFAVIPRLNGFEGPLAILVDGASASTSEIMAGGLQDLKRARIFGTRTAGAALPSVIESLPNGDLFQFAVANYVSESGRELEGVGVKPDVEVGHTLAALRAGNDRTLGAAINWIYAKPTSPVRP
jgi:carboxyl-terminal processing protease